MSRIQTFMKTVLASLLLALPLSFSGQVLAAGAGVHLDKAPIDIRDQASLQRGAKVFVNYCLGCHQMQYQRYNRVAADLGIPEDLLLENLVFTDSKAGDHMTNAMPQQAAGQWFGTAPPDLTLSARLRGTDWLYTYLRTFYADPSRPFGVNNLVFKDVGMPHVLEELQGTPYKRYEKRLVDGESKVTEVGLGTMGNGELSSDEYDLLIADLVNFMAYSADPVKLTRLAMAPWVIGFLLVFLVLIYLLKKEYWRELKPGGGISPR